MRDSSAAMHVAKIVRKHRGTTYVSYLLRQSYRYEGKVKHRTLGNLSHLPPRLLDLIQRSLAGEVFVSPAEAFRTTQSRPHGHVEAVLTTCRRLDLVPFEVDDFRILEAIRHKLRRITPVYPCG